MLLLSSGNYSAVTFHFFTTLYLALYYRNHHPQLHLPPSSPATPHHCSPAPSLTDLCWCRSLLRESRAAADQRPDDVLPEAGEAGGERVRRHPAEVWVDSAADNECGGLFY